MTALADALRGGGKFVKWNDVGQGTVISGTVISTALRQSKKMKKVQGAWIDEGPAFWDDGSPKMEAAIELDTTMRDDTEDDGVRTVSVNLWSGQKRALADACKAAARAEPLPGDTFAAVWTSGAGDPGDPRVFVYKLTPGTGLAAAITTPAPADPFAGAPAAPHSPPAAAPAPAPQPAPAPATAAPLDKPAQVAQLHAAGLDVTTIASVTGYTPEAVQALIVAAAPY